MKTCTNCAEQIDTAWDFCDTCGSIVQTGSEGNIECEVHPENYAIGICVVCGMPVCAKCGVKDDGKILCSDPDHRSILQEWRMVCRLESEFEADAMICNLAAAGIGTKSFSLHEYIATHWLIQNRVLVFVKKSEYEKATGLLQELNLIGQH